MELRELIRIIIAGKRAIFISIVCGMLIAAGVSFSRLHTTQASFSLIIRPHVLEKTNNFQFTDVLEASDRVTRMTENWMNEQSWHANTRRLGNQVIAVTLPSGNEDLARTQMSAIIKQTNVFLQSLSPTQALGSFEALGSDFSFTRQSPYWEISLPGGVLIGLFLGIGIALFTHYL